MLAGFCGVGQRRGTQKGKWREYLLRTVINCCLLFAVGQRRDRVAAVSATG